MQVIGLTLIVLASLFVAFERGWRPGGYIEYPFLFAVVLVGWIVPQLWYLTSDVLLPQGAVEKLQLIILLTLAMVVVGWKLGTRGAYPSGVTPTPPIHAVIPITIVLTGISFVLDSLLIIYRDQWIAEGGGQQATGTIPVLAFFGSVRIIPLWLSVHLFLRKRSTIVIALLAVNIIGTGTIAFVLLRRSEMIDFFFVMLTAFWFTRRFQVPKAVLIAGILLVTPVMYSIGALRGAAIQVKEETGQDVGLLSFRTLSKIDFGQSTVDAASKAPDLANAVALIDYTDRWDRNTLGANTWNKVVWLYVPAIVFGPELKRELQIDWAAKAYDQFDYQKGTTPTGFGFVYQEFGLFGPVYFLVVSFVFGRVWLWCNRGDFWSMPLLASFGSLALTSITHAPTQFFLAMPLFVAVISLCRTITRKHMTRALRAEVQAARYATVAGRFVPEIHSGFQDAQMNRSRHTLSSSGRHSNDRYRT